MRQQRLTFQRRAYRAGFTLIEALIASAVLAFIVAALTQAIVAGQMQSADAIENLRGLTLAETLMEEILSKPYSDPEGASVIGPEAGETARALYDNADDYHNFTQTAGTVSDAAGVLYASAYQRYSRSVTCTYTTATLTTPEAAIAGLSITVTVTSANGKSWSVTRFRMEPSS